MPICNTGPFVVPLDTDLLQLTFLDGDRTTVVARYKVVRELSGDFATLAMIISNGEQMPYERVDGSIFPGKIEALERMCQQLLVYIGDRTRVWDMEHEFLDSAFLTFFALWMTKRGWRKNSASISYDAGRGQLIPAGGFTKFNPGREHVFSGAGVYTVDVAWTTGYLTWDNVYAETPEELEEAVNALCIDEDSHFAYNSDKNQDSEFQITGIRRVADRPEAATYVARLVIAERDAHE